MKDKSQIYLTIDGRQVDVKKGKFEFPGFVIDPSEGEVLKIVATDRWQNKSEKTINIKVEFKQTADTRSYEKPNPNNIRTKTDNDKIAIIIGIEKYQALSNLDAPYANRDANVNDRSVPGNINKTQTGQPGMRYDQRADPDDVQQNQNSAQAATNAAEIARLKQLVQARR